MILDTSFLIDVLRGSTAVEDLLETVDARGTAAVSTVSVMELWEGVQRAAASDRERAAVEALLGDIRTAPFDRNCAIKAGALNAELAEAGTPVATADVMIAATAHVHDWPVVTRNVEDFERFDDLEVLTY